MSDKASELMSTISEHISFLLRNDDNFREVIAAESDMEAKRLSYSHSLYDGVLTNASRMVHSLLQDVPDLYAIRRYYLKPFLEDFINLYNIGKYGKDYVRAMQVHFMSEDYDIDLKYRNDYDKLGASFNKDKDESKEHTTEKIYKHFEKIPLDISKLILVNTEKNRFNLPVGARIALTRMQVTNGVSLWALYDYANIHHHYNLRFKWLVDEDNEKFVSLLLTKLEEYIQESVRIIYEVFEIEIDD